MKKKKVLLLAVVATIGLTAYKIADDILTRLGMQQQAAQNAIISNIIGRFDSGPMDGAVEDGPSNSVYGQLKSFRLPYAKLLPDIIAGDKVAAAKELCDYVKEYINSETFMEEYRKLKESSLPLTDKGMSFGSLKRNSEVFRLNIKNYPNDTKYVAEQQKQLEENEKRIATLLEVMKKPFPGKDVWEKTYPADPAVLIKKRLQEYIQLAATVDFNAKLTGSGKRQTFVNPVYEKKSLKWKAIYRAGKEVNDVITIFAKDWLKEGVVLNNR
ncbi:MAG TPA: hypothetical protein VGO58_09265 [Chitinophagaceae bacterium]|jgi:hypothetical protein|nr:hypothetical protein [Chitinophagaceae bacterium]